MSAAAKPPVRSMTGFARLRRITPRGELVLSLRGVNHRGLDLHFHMSPELEPMETPMRKAISACVLRGHIDVRAHLQPAKDAGAAAWNRPLMATWIRAFREAAREHNLPGEPDLNAAFRLPGMLSTGAGEELDSETGGVLLSLLQEALQQYNMLREREGIETAAVLLGYGASIRSAAGEMETIRQDIVPALKTRLEERVSELLRGAAVDPARLAQEAALLADRSDIGEEVTRLGMHASRLTELLEAGGEIGKKLDFLLQEMQRETNTALSKTNGTGEPGRRITELALAVKSWIEKIREQALNLE